MKQTLESFLTSCCLGNLGTYNKHTASKHFVYVNLVSDGYFLGNKKFLSFTYEVEIENRISPVTT